MSVASRPQTQKATIRTLRYERKFLVSDLTHHEIMRIVRTHPAMFREIYSPRQVNNLYFDTHDIRHYADNLSGLAERTKVRLRWYGDLFGMVSRPTLEVKGKEGVASWKESYPLTELRYPPGGAYDIRSLISERLDASDRVRWRFEVLNATLLNSYSRQYFLSATGEFRLTIDKSVKYYRVGLSGEPYLEQLCDDESLIVELKYKADADQLAENVSSHLPFLVTKSSKYAAGMGRFNDEI